MRSHTAGGIIPSDRSGLVCKSSKQMLDMKRSTEAEVVGASDYLPHTLWVKMFMEAQGLGIKESVLVEQDNESAIKMEKNSKASAGPRSRHIDIRYFWIKDRSIHTFYSLSFCAKVSVRRPFPWYCFYADKSTTNNDQRGAPPPLLSSSVHCHLSF